MVRRLPGHVLPYELHYIFIQFVILKRQVRESVLDGQRLRYLVFLGKAQGNQYLAQKPAPLLLDGEGFVQLRLRDNPPFK